MGFEDCLDLIEDREQLLRSLLGTNWTARVL
jgi:hypothetical protein